MKKATLVLLFVYTHFINISEQSQTCLSCTDLAEGETCQHIVTCPDNEVCYLQKYSTSLGETRYDVGCINKMMCPSASLQGKRSSDHSHILCHKCCNNTRLCNMDLSCDKTDIVQGQSCLSCSDVDDPASCNATVTCGSNEVCYTHLYVTESKHRMYDLGCKPSFFCQGDKNPFGKRSSEGRHLLCGTCCRSNNCNLNSSCTNYYIKSNVSGVYNIYPGNQVQPVPVYCIMEKGKKWTVIQRRINGSVDFYRTWDEYKSGFGNAEGEYWLGNDFINTISNDGHHELSVVLELLTGNTTYANYTDFSVRDEQNQYFLTVSDYNGTAGDGIGEGGKHGGNNNTFSTLDRDNDSAGFSYSCAKSQRGGWWYGYCSEARINEVYRRGKLYWKNYNNVGSSIMMIRRT